MRTPEGCIVDTTENIRMFENTWENRADMGEWGGVSSTRIFDENNGRIESVGIVINHERIIPMGYGKKLEENIKRIEETIVYAIGMGNDG